MNKANRHALNQARIHNARAAQHLSRENPSWEALALALYETRLSRSYLKTLMQNAPLPCFQKDKGK